jgi:hypothetical protein
MRAFVLFICCSSFLVSATSTAQKQDYYWPLGKDRLMDPEFGALEFDFNQAPFEVGVREAGLEFGQNNASICDAEGNLLFYSNGCAVANRHHQVMPRGDSINEGIFFDEFWLGDCAFGYPGRQNMLILQDPADDLGYYMIHIPTSIVDTASFEIDIERMLYSYVDMRLDGGNGDVTIKNRPFHLGQVFSSYITAISHSNQKDWWILNPVLPSGYVLYLLDDQGLNLHSWPEGPIWDDFFSNDAGDARFSPDGTKYAVFNRWEGIRVYDFDRSTGGLNNEQVIPWHFDDTGFFTTCEWSPSSQFLYVAQFDSLFQLDVTAEPLSDGLVFIEEFNGVQDPLSTFFAKSALGPDCRIYLRSLSSTRSFHVINKPDEPGLACDFVQQGIRLPVISSAGSFPNFPRFRVDEEEKCDPSITSLFGETVWYRRDLTTYPNPVSDGLTIELPEEMGEGRVYLLGIDGQLIWEGETFSGQTELQLDMRGYAEGRYSVEYMPRDNKERRVWTSSVMVVR